MTEGRTPDCHGTPDPETFSDKMISGLLRIAFNPDRRPVDHLIERLQQKDATEWFNNSVAEGPVAAAGNPEELLIKGDADKEVLEKLKEASKQEFGEAKDATVRLRGLLNYLFVIAAGLEHHAQLMSSQPRGEISAVLLELALSLPAPWNDFVAEAAMTPT